MTSRAPAPQHSAPDPPNRSVWQKIRNESWPLKDRNGHGQHARGILASRHPVDVMVWLDFERDGVCWLPARAVRWHGRQFCVPVDDERLQVPSVWVDAVDVQRP